MIPCQRCHAECLNGLALCDLCRRAGSTYLEFIPVHFRNLARWRPERAGSRPVPGSREPRAITNDTGSDKVSRALDEVGNDLVTWAKALMEDRGVEVPDNDGEAEQAAAICRTLNEHLTSIATTDWAGELVETVSAIERRLRSLTEEVVPGWYAGECKQPVAFDDEGAVIRCEYGTYVVPGLTWVQCSACGARTYARDHLETVLTEARPWVARPMRVAEALVALLDTELSVPRLHKRISKWAERGSNGGVVPVRRRDADGDEVGPKLVRLGDVLDRLAVEGATRTSGTVDNKTAAAS